MLLQWQARATGVCYAEHGVQSFAVTKGGFYALELKVLSTGTDEWRTYDCTWVQVYDGTFMKLWDDGNDT